MHNIEEVEQLALQLMKQHGLLGKGWVFKFDNAKRRFGLCRLGERVDSEGYLFTIQEISLSRHLVLLNLSNDGKLRDVILHEISHALASRYARHNAEWKSIAQSIGCTGDRCYNNSKGVIDPPSKYICFCKKCGKVSDRNKNNENACGRCCRQFNNGKHGHKYRLIVRERETIEAAGGIEAYKQEWAREHGVTFCVHDAVAQAA